LLWARSVIGTAYGVLSGNPCDCRVRPFKRRFASWTLSPRPCAHKILKTKGAQNMKK
jgi:hypothetical protein